MSIYLHLVIFHFTSNSWRDFPGTCMCVCVFYHFHLWFLLIPQPHPSTEVPGSTPGFRVDPRFYIVLWSTTEEAACCQKSLLSLGWLWKASLSDLSTLWRFPSSQFNAAHHLDRNQVDLDRRGCLDGSISARLDADESWALPWRSRLLSYWGFGGWEPIRSLQSCFPQTLITLFLQHKPCWISGYWRRNQLSLAVL